MLIILQKERFRRLYDRMSTIQLSKDINKQQVIYIRFMSWSIRNKLVKVKREYKY